MIPGTASRYRFEWGLLGGVLLILGGLIGYSLYQEQGQIAATERDRLQVQARVVAENLGRQLEGVNNALMGVRENLLPWDPKNKGIAVSRQLKVLSDAMPGVRAIGIFDAEGTALASSRKELIGNIIAREREFFTVPRARPDRDVLYVSPPFKSVLLGLYSITVVRAVIGPAGEFAGIVVATLEPEYFDVALRSVLYAPDMLTGLVHGDGRAFLYVPANAQALGKDLAVPGSNFSRHRDSGQIMSVFAGPIYSTGEERVTVLRNINPADLHMDKPLIIGVSRRIADIQATWRAEAIAYGASYGTFALMAILTLYIAQQRRRIFDRVAARHEAEQKESAERLRLATEAAGMGVFEYDLVSGRATWDDTMFALHGVNPAGFTSRYEDWQKSVLPEDLPAAETALRAVGSEGTNSSTQYRVRRGDGQIRVIRTLAQARRDRTGRPAKVVGVSEDITERKQVEAANARLAAIVATSNDAIIGRDLDRKIVSWNAAAERMFGYAAADAIGQSISMIVPPDRQEEFDRSCALLAQGRPVIDLETVRLANDGRRIDVSMSQSPILDESGAMMGVSLVFRDISERKRVEAEVRTLSRATEQSTASIVITDPAGAIEYVNPRFETVTGYTRAEVAGKNPRILRSGKTNPEVYEQLWAAISGGGEWRGELCNRRKNGELFWEYAAISGLKDEHGQIVHYVAVKEDITERKQAEATQAMLEAQLREAQKMEAIGTLAGGIAHDFNNILATILGNAELARQDMIDSPPALESLGEIRKAASRARTLVQQILAFSRRQPTERKVTALGPVVDESVRLLRATLPARLTLEVHFDFAVPPVLADATQIQQVVINLATNAVQAIRSGPGHIDIRLDTVTLDADLAEAQPALRAMHAQRPGRTVRLTVSDDGPGMDAAMLGRIFEPFFTTKEVNEGTGLGLAVVHGIVRAHEGAIVVDSQPGKGTSFTVYLPAAEVQTSAPPPDASVAAIAPALRLDGGRHVLYLDDDDALVLLVERLLERRGFRISGYTDQRKALDALRADPAGFDLVVTDYNMPGMSGLDVAHEVRAIRADLPVAVISGFLDEELRAKAGDAGVQELIFKENSVEDLCAVIARLTQTDR